MVYNILDFIYGLILAVCSFLISNCLFELWRIWYDGRKDKHDEEKKD